MNTHYAKKLKLPDPPLGASASVSGFTFAKPAPPSQPKNDVQEDYYKNSMDDVLVTENFPTKSKTETGLPTDQPASKNDISKPFASEEVDPQLKEEQTDPETVDAMLSLMDSDDDQIIWDKCSSGETQGEPLLECLQTSDSEDSEKEETRHNDPPSSRKLRRQSTLGHVGVAPQERNLFKGFDTSADISKPIMTSDLP